MKVSLHIVEERRRQLADYLQQHAYAPLREVCTRFAVSEATARRDLVALAASHQIVRTRGGALTEYISRFPSFRQREEKNPAAKARIAAAARDLILPDSTCFLDFGTTIHALAEELCHRPVAKLQVITNNLPVADLLITVPGIRVHLLGGELLPRQSSLLGGPASKALRFYSIDQAFLSAEAADDKGVWNSQSALAGLQQKVLQEAPRRVLCIDDSKLGRQAPAFLAAWNHFDLIVTDAHPKKIKRLTPGETLSV